MKPADHPEFFRMPAPAGRSRESTIVLTRHGRFQHDGERFSHRGLEQGFARWIRRHPDDGRFILTNGYDWCYFSVEDTPYFVTGLRSQDGRPMLELFDGSSEPLDPDTLSVDDDDVLRTRVKGGAYQARFSQAAQLQLMPWLSDDEPLALAIAGQRYAIRPSAAVNS